MPITRNLQGVGTGAAQARAIVGVMDRNKTATGTTRADAYLLSEDVTLFTVVPANTGAALRSDSQENDVYTVVNSGANALKIYPPIGGTVDGAGVNVAYSLAAGSFADFQALGDNIFVVREQGDEKVLAALAASSGAGLIGWIRNALSAVATTVAQWLGWQPINVLEFMTDAQRADVLDGTGSLDVTAAVQAAVTASQARVFGGKVYAPAGKYRLASQVNFPLTKFIEFYGDGKATKFFGATGFGTLFSVAVSDNAAQGSIFRDFMMVAPAAGSTNGISLNAANVFLFERIWLQSQNVSISAANTYAAEFNECVFDVSASEAIKFTTSAHGTLIKGCNFYTCGVSGSKAAVNFTTASNNIVLDYNSFEDCYRPASLQDCTSVSINANYIEYSDVSDFEFLGTCYGISMCKNWIALGAATFSIANVNGMEFNNNTVYNQTVSLGANVNQLDARGNTTLGTGAINIAYVKIDSKALSGLPTISGYAVGGTNTGFAIDTQGTEYIYLYTGGVKQAQIAYTASAVNSWELTGGATGASVKLRPVGTDANIAANVASKGNGQVSLSSGTGGIQFSAEHVAISVNYFSAYGAAASAIPYLRPNGVDADIQARISSKGAADVTFYTNTVNILSFVVGYVASAVNWLRAAPSSTGNAVTLTAQGSDSNIPVSIISKGTSGVICQGTSTNDSASAGKIGEFVTSTVASGSAISLTNNTTANVTSISLTAGDWWVWAAVNFTLTGATSTHHKMGISLTSATMPSQAGGSGLGTDPLAILPLPTTVLSDTLTMHCATRISIASTTTVYMVAEAAFSAGTDAAYGTISARRMR